MTSVSSILNGAFGLIRDNFPATLVWCGCYLVVTVGSAFYWAPIQLAMFAPEDPAQAFGRMPALLASYGLFVLGCAAIQMILLTAAYRAVLRPTQSGFGFIRFGADELREIVLGIAMMAAFYALLVGGLVAIFAAGVLLGSTGTAGMVLGILLAIIFSLAFVGLCIWLAVRLCLAFPLTLLRRRFAIGDRAFTVLGEPSFDGRSGEWSARLLFVPLDHSLPRSVASEPLARSPERDAVVRQLEHATDRAIASAFRSIVLPLPRRTRVR